MYFHAEGELSAVFISDMTATLLTSETSNWTSDFGVAESLNQSYVSLSVVSTCRDRAQRPFNHPISVLDHQANGGHARLNTLVSFHQP